MNNIWQYLTVFDSILQLANSIDLVKEIIYGWLGLVRELKANLSADYADYTDYEPPQYDSSYLRGRQTHTDGRRLLSSEYAVFKTKIMTWIVASNWIVESLLRNSNDFLDKIRFWTV